MTGEGGCPSVLAAACVMVGLAAVATVGGVGVDLAGPRWYKGKQQGALRSTTTGEIDDARR